MSTARQTTLVNDLVGYAELEAVYGWPRRTVQDWVKRGKLRRGTQLPGGHVYWRISDIEDFIGLQRGDLAASAVNDPRKLKPELMEDAARDLIARAASVATGVKVAVEQTVIGHIRPATPQEVDARRAETAELFRKSPYRDMPEHVQLAVALHMFPALREVLGQLGWEVAGQIDDDIAYRMALDALRST